MNGPATMPGATNRARVGWLRAHRFLLLRRSVQLGVLGLFLLGPLAGIWVLTGSIAGSLVFEQIPLTDPYLLLQELAAGHGPATAGLVGGAIVVAFYVLVGGRAYCAWVCPINPVTDLAAWLRRRLGLRGGARLSRRTRHALLAATLVAAAIGGTLAWELLNPVTLVYRGLLFGLGLGWSVLVAIFVFDLLLAPHGWCGHLCPTGAFYGLLGDASLVRVRADGRERCDDCLDCYAVCPEPHVIAPALKPRGPSSPVIRAGACHNCGRCIDVCARDVFRFGHRFHSRSPSAATHNREVLP